MAGIRNPDLQRLLANLRGDPQLFNSIPQEQRPDIPTTSSTQHSTANSLRNCIPGLGLLQPDDRERRPVHAPTPSVQPQKQNPTTQLPSRPLTPIVADASTITTWPAALKHVTKHIVSNEIAATKIKHLISEQHKHERQWWAGREAIVNRHSGRTGNQAKVADLLKSLGGVSVPVVAHDPKADGAELEAYDRKVYKSLTDMTSDFDRQLRGLQVPFFAIKHDLVILKERASKDGNTMGKLDTGELRELQRRMVETLEDLLGDD